VFTWKMYKPTEF